MRRNTGSQENWVAFPDAAEATDGQLIVGYAGLPAGLDSDRLQVNTAALTRGVIGWGGYSALTLAAYKGDEDHYAIGTGTDSGGNAYGIGSATVSKAESSQLQPASEKVLNASDVRNGSLGIQWNMSALNSRIETYQQYDPNIRAKQISREIRKNAVRGILRHNLGDTISDKPSPIIALQAGFDAWFLSQIGRDVLRTEYASAASGMAVRAFALGVMIRGLRTIFSQGAPYEEQIIDPFFWTARPTRAIVGAGVIATSRLVRATPATAQG